MGNNVFIRPGALIIFFVALGLGIGIFNWSSNLLDQSSAQNQTSKAIDCTTLGVDVINSGGNSTHHEVGVQMSQNVDAFAVTFKGSQNATVVSDYGGPGSISRVKAQISEVEDIEIRVDGCSRVFRY